LALFSLILTGSRSGVLALLAVMVAGVLVAGPRRRMQALAGAVVITATAALFFVAFAPPAIKARLGETVPGQVPATEGRTTIWQVGWRMVEDNPVKGVGLGSFQTSSIHYVIEPGALDRTDQIIDTPKVAHNIYLQALAELGVIGLVMILGILIFPVVCALRAAKRFARAGNGQMVIISKAVVVALVGIFTADFFASEISSKLLWLLLALGPTLLAISSDEARVKEPGLSPQRRSAVARA
jgi:O-antigen ligase